jgi:protein-tyrosine phosphatase
MTTQSLLTNLREVGGSGLQAGRRRTIFRSNTEVTDPGEYPASVETVVDLRRDDEIEVVPHPLGSTAGYRRAPLFDPSQIEAAADALELEDQYTDWIQRHQRTIAVAFRTIADSEGDVLLCCAAGKDRTGVVSALLARLWGADLETIGTDYAATGPNLVERFRKELAESTDVERTKRMHRCVPETGIRVVEFVEEQYGSVPAYLRTIGLTDDEIARL